MEAVLSVVEHISKERDQLLHMVLMLIILNTLFFFHVVHIFLSYLHLPMALLNLDITHGLNMDTIIYCTKMSVASQFPPTAYFSYFCPF